MDLNIISQRRQPFFRTEAVGLGRPGGINHWRCVQTCNVPTLILKGIVGASGIGELIANTLAVRGVTTVVLDINPIVTENCR